jgi:penicillin-binding protein 1A
VQDSEACVINWCVHNYNGESFGNVPLWLALTHSINTIAVKLMVDVGRKNVEATAHRVGIKGDIDPYPTMSIGTSALTLMDMATGYATFAAGGKLAHPYSVLEIRKPTGELLYSHAANEKDAEQVDPYDKVAELNSMMHDVVMQGTATRAQLGYAPVAGKTGTNANYRDAWFFGFTAHNVTGVWVGNDDNTPMNGSKEFAVTGGRVPAPAWKRIMDVAELGLKPEGFAGVPMDDTYKPLPTPIIDPALVALAPALPANKPLVDEVATAAPDASAEPDFESVSVLNGMMDLFQNNADTPAPAAAPVQYAPKKRKFALPKRHIVPRVPKKKSLFDLLFGSRTPVN